MIDIVVTYLNERDKQWNEDFNYWKNKEINNGKNEKNNRQAFGRERTREWDCFKYWFRAVSKNCPWVNKVYLVVQNENHVPKWLNINNPKLKVVYHKDYVPEECLPTFNAMTIAMYISNIKDLTEQYIMCDDDYYFLNYIDKERFFQNGKPMHENNEMAFNMYKNKTNDVFYSILNNNIKFEKNINFGKAKMYGIYHLPEARLKSFEQKIISDHYYEILSKNICSKFRHKDNLCPYMFSDLLKIKDMATLSSPYYNCKYITLKSDVDFDKLKNYDIICLNDTEQLDDYDKTKEKMVAFLEEKFPDKCEFEL